MAILSCSKSREHEHAGCGKDERRWFGDGEGGDEAVFDPVDRGDADEAAVVVDIVDELDVVESCSGKIQLIDIQERLRR